MKFIFFSVLENGENGLGDEGSDWGNPTQHFWARTALKMMFLCMCECVIDAVILSV